MANKKTSKTPTTRGGDALSDAVTTLAHELVPLWHLEGVAESLEHIATSLNGLSNAVALSVIATHGNAKDQAMAVKILKRWFVEFERKD